MPCCTKFLEQLVSRVFKPLLHCFAIGGSNMHQRLRAQMFNKHIPDNAEIHSRLPATNTEVQVFVAVEESFVPTV